MIQLQFNPSERAEAVLSSGPGMQVEKHFAQVVRFKRMISRTGSPAKRRALSQLSPYFCSMNHTRTWSFVALICLIAIGSTGCSEDDTDFLTEVTISETELNAYLAMDTLEIITENLTEYFKATNEARWGDLMHYFPLHKKQGDTAFVNGSMRALDHWTERGVRNRTASAEILYASPCLARQRPECRPLEHAACLILLNFSLSTTVLLPTA